MHEYVRSDTTGQPVRPPRVPPGAAFKRSGSHKNYHRSQHRTEEEWLKARIRLNRAPWHGATGHVLTITGATDASSHAWSGLIREPFGTIPLFRAAVDFPSERYNAHINVKETFALHEVLKLARTTHPEYLKGSTAVNDAGNKEMYGCL